MVWFGVIHTSESTAMHLQFFTFLILILALSFPVRADVVVVRNDGGGNISDYIDRRQKLAKEEAVRIEGKCYSACTIFTTLPNACVMPKAQIGFHGSMPRIPLMQKWLDMRMGDFYRGEVRKRYANDWRHLWGPKLHVISGKELKSLDPEIRLCR